MKRFNTTIIKKYLILCLAALLVFSVFIFLEKNNHTYAFVLNNDDNLNAQSIQVLKQVKVSKAIVFEVYTSPSSLVAKKISQFFTPFLRINKNIHIKFIDPITHPSEVKLNAITMQGEMLLKFRDSDSGRKINITELSESSIINAILTLYSDKDEWLVVSEGFGMPDIADKTGIGLSELLIHLKKIGFNIVSMPLNKGIELPDSVKVIMLPAPTEALDAEIVEWLNTQTEKGIGIWWLNDVEASNQPHLELMFDVMNADKVALENDKNTAYFSGYAQHAITKNFNQPLFIAEARSIIADSYLPLFVTQADSTIAVAKQLDKSRIVITGDADFIRNQYINTAANKSMTVRILDWLFYNDERVNIPVKISNNTQLLLTQYQLLGFSLFFLIIIPILFLVIGFVQWRNNRAG